MVAGPLPTPSLAKCTGTQLSILPLFQAWCWGPQLCVGSLMHSPSRLVPLAVLSRNGIRYEFGSAVLVVGL